MDIPRLSMAMRQGSLMNAVNLSLMKIQMNNSKDMMEGMTKIMESASGNPSIGNNIDVEA